MGGWRAQRQQGLGENGDTRCGCLASSWHIQVGVSGPQGANARPADAVTLLDAPSSHRSTSAEAPGNAVAPALAPWSLSRPVGWVPCERHSGEIGSIFRNEGGEMLSACGETQAGSHGGGSVILCDGEFVFVCCCVHWSARLGGSKSREPSGPLSPSGQGGGGARPVWLVGNER